MNPCFRNCRERALIARQRGLVLFIALIALVVLSLAAVALIRSVDTATLIAGNLAFKQSATNAGEGALIQANKWLATQAAIPAALDTSVAGYFALVTYNSYAALSAETTWTAANSYEARVAACDGTFTTNVDCSGNTIRYIVERMCTSAGAADTGKCLYGPTTDSTSSKTVKEATGALGIVTSTGSLIYRVTARVTGPKNSVSYIQTFIY